MNSKLITDLFTESDNETWDLGRVQGTIAFGCFLFYSFWAYVVRNQTFDPQTFGIGFGAVATGYGAMIWMKGKEQAAATTSVVSTTVNKPTPTQVTAVQTTTESKNGHPPPNG